MIDVLWMQIDGGTLRQPEFDTIQLHGGQIPDPTPNARAVPIYASTSFVFNDSQHGADLFGLKYAIPISLTTGLCSQHLSLRAPGHIYSRIHNPTVVCRAMYVLRASDDLRLGRFRGEDCCFGRGSGSGRSRLWTGCSVPRCLCPRGSWRQHCLDVGILHVHLRTQLNMLQLLPLRRSKSQVSDFEPEGRS